MRFPWRLVIAAAFTLTISGCMWSQQRAVRSQSVVVAQRAAGAVHVKSRNGSVEVIADPSIDGAEVSAKLYCTGATIDEAEQRVAQMTVRAEIDANGVLVVEPVFPGGQARDGDGASFSIKIAAANGVIINTSNGRVSVSGFRGELRIDTSNGSVSVDDHEGSVHIDTSNARVDVNRVFGSVTIDTSNGGVHAVEVGAPAVIETSNGPITLNLAGDASGPITLDTSNGSIKARVGRNFAGSVTMDTSNGSLRVNDRSGRVTSSNLDRTDGVVQIGNGGEPSRMDSSNGSIELTIEG